MAPATQPCAQQVVQEVSRPGPARTDYGRAEQVKVEAVLLHQPNQPDRHRRADNRPSPHRQCCGNTLCNCGNRDSSKPVYGVVLVSRDIRSQASEPTLVLVPTPRILVGLLARLLLVPLKGLANGKARHLSSAFVVAGSLNGVGKNGPGFVDLNHIAMRTTPIGMALGRATTKCLSDRIAVSITRDAQDRIVIGHHGILL
jgi:hypothetical protein